jgi:hypothetical protein
MRLDMERTIGPEEPIAMAKYKVVAQWAQDKFLLAPLLPHKCGSEELCRAPLAQFRRRFQKPICAPDSGSGPRKLTLAKIDLR